MSDKQNIRDETAHLLNSPANAARLRAALKDANAGAPGLILTGEEFVALADDPADVLSRHA
jgi:CHASE3 domain sensor protein